MCDSSCMNVDCDYDGGDCEGYDGMYGGGAFRSLQDYTGGHGERSRSQLLTVTISESRYRDCANFG